MARTQQKSSQYLLKPAEIKKLIFSCTNFRNRCLIKLLAYTGMARAEVRDLDIQDIDFERRRIHIRNWGQQILDEPERFNNRFYQKYIVLNYCRMVHDLHTGSTGSKRAGAAWAKATLDPSWAGLIDHAW